MNALTGMEKFSHLEDKIYLTVQYVQNLREDRDEIASQLKKVTAENSELTAERDQLEATLSRLLNERDAVQLKVEGMLESLRKVDPAVMEAFGA
jgi:uncharacterized coiled-coil DUF342 family protein